MAYTLIRNGTLIDGNGGTPLQDAAILIDNERIRSVGRANDISLPKGELTEVDARGGFILPGFIDTHVHVMFEGLDLMRIMATPFSLKFYESMAFMKRTLEAGVTTVRDAGGADAGVKEAVERGLIMGPRMQISITVLTTTGGHADFWMRSGMDISLFPSYPGNPEGRCDGIEEVRKKVREVLRAGAEVIKVCATGGVSSPTDHPNFTQFTEDELAVMVEEGRFRQGVRVMAHAQGAEGIKNAVRAGIHSIEHGIYLDDECIELMRERGTFLVPTLLAPVGMLEVAEQTGRVPEWAIEKSREALEAHRESVAKAYKAGVKIAMGTDAGVMPHGSNLRELGLMVNVGMTPMEVITASTKTAAACLGWEDKVGTLEGGKLADVVVCKRNPLEDVRVLERGDNLQLVMKGGEIIRSGA